MQGRDLGTAASLLSFYGDRITMSLIVAPGMFTVWFCSARLSVREHNWCVQSRASCQLMEQGPVIQKKRNWASASHVPFMLHTGISQTLISGWQPGKIKPSECRQALDGTISLVMEGNVIALGIWVIFIDQASSMLLFFLRGSGSAGGWFRLTSHPLHTQAGSQSLTQLKNGAGSPSVTKQEAEPPSVWDWKSR